MAASSSASFVPRGRGKRQRLNFASRALDPGVHPERTRVGAGPLDGDPEVDKLLELFALGLLSATTIRDIAGAAVQVAPRPQMNVLAALGTEGRHSNNIHRELSRKLMLNKLNLPEPL